MKFSNKTNINKNNDYIGLNNTLKEIRRLEFTFEEINHTPVQMVQNHFIDLIQNFYLSFFQNQKV